MFTRSTILLALLVALVATGCTSTRIVSRTDVGAVTQVGAALQGHDATVHLTTGAREHGRIAFVRVDSIGWTGAGSPQAVSLLAVRSVVRDTRWSSAGRGALIGAGVGLGIAALGVATTEREEPDDGWSPGAGFSIGAEVLFIVLPPVSALYGAGIGAALGRRVEYRFVE